MKELSIEEKAKRYDEILARAEGAKLPYYKENIMSKVKEFVDYLIPEIKESEDERIRNRLIAMCKHYIECYALDPYNINGYKEALAWLEKQGKNNMGISEATKKKLEDNLNKALEKETPESCNEFLEKQGDQKPIIEMKSAEESLDIDSETYSKIVDECIYGEQKSAAWSEEEEKILNYLLWFYDTRFRWNDTCCDDIKFGDIVNFLKALKERYTWKPSDEQMLAINTAINVLGKGTINGKYLIELHEQLKKLREE